MYIRMQDLHNLPELVVLIEQYEDLVKEQPRITNHTVQHETQPVTTTTTKPVGQTQQPQPKPRATDCWRCVERGHTRIDCQKPRVQLCFLFGNDPQQLHIPKNVVSSIDTGAARIVINPNTASVCTQTNAKAKKKLTM